MQKPKLLQSGRKIFHKWFRYITTALLFISIIVMVVLGSSIQYQDLQSTYSLAVKTTTFLQTECEKYENYTRGIQSGSLEDLLDHATSLSKYVADASLTDSDFLNSFIHTEHIGGAMVWDSDLTLLASADMDHLDSVSAWKAVMEKKAVQNILSCSLKTFVGSVLIGDVPYDFAVVASTDASKLILCYSSAVKPSTDPYEFSIKTILENNNFYKNPTVVITDGSQILSTNDSIVAELGSSQYHYLSENIDWKDDELVKFRYNGTTFYGLRRVYGKYYLYAVYTSKEVFTDRTNYIILAFLIYTLICIHYLFAMRHVDKDNIAQMQKQLRTINAISTAYSSTFLLHVDRMELEPIHASARLEKAFEEHSAPYDFLFYVCQNYVKREHRGIIMDFLDLKTIASRLKGIPYIGNSVMDSNGVWYSVMLIPQRLDAEGNVQALLVTTQDITSVKQAEELSFTDKLTGLHNRNYMEARSENFMRAGEQPVSLIMADCNYLKRTNDTLGHEYGDKLLRRVAQSIQECLPADSVAMRIGGDEFLIQCAHCSAAQAEQLVQAIRTKLIEHSDEVLKLSVSFGSCTVENANISFRDAYEAADQAMYKEKEEYHQKNQ